MTCLTVHYLCHQISLYERAKEYGRWRQRVKPYGVTDTMSSCSFSLKNNKLFLVSKCVQEQQQ